MPHFLVLNDRQNNNQQTIEFQTSNNTEKCK